MKRSGATGVLLVILLFPAGVLAESQSDVTYLVPPEPIDIQPPIFPKNAAGDEAWIQLGFTVKADGSTADFVMTDGFGSDAFKDATISAAKKWKLKPGTENGTPVDWTNYTFNIPFAYLDTTAGAYPAFSMRYDGVVKLLQQKQFAEAKAAIQEAYDKHAVRLLYEYAISQYVLYSAETGLGHPQAAYKAIRSATPVMQVARRVQQPELGSRINKKVQLSASAMLPDQTLEPALRSRFLAEANLGLYLDALDTYERLAKLEAIAPTDPLVEQVKLIRGALASDQPLGVTGRIENGTWLGRPARRKFSFADVNGSIEIIRISCNRHGAVLPFQANVDWEMPASWGDCEVLASGGEGTEFLFVQAGPPVTSRSAPQTPLTVSPEDKLVTMPSPLPEPQQSTPY